MNYEKWEAEPYSQEIPGDEPTFLIKGEYKGGTGNLFLVVGADPHELQLLKTAPQLLAAAKDALEQITVDIEGEWPHEKAREILALYEPLRQAIHAAEHID